MHVCIQVWIRLCPCMSWVHKCGNNSMSISRFLYVCVYLHCQYFCLYFCMSALFRLHYVHTYNVHCFFLNIGRALHLSTEFVYSVCPWGVCVCMCVLIMAPDGLGLPLMWWRPTGVKQVQSGAWVLPINPFHRVKPNIIAWGAGGHWAMACPA